MVRRPHLSHSIGSRRMRLGAEEHKMFSFDFSKLYFPILKSQLWFFAFVKEYITWPQIVLAAIAFNLNLIQLRNYFRELYYSLKEVQHPLQYNCYNYQNINLFKLFFHDCG
mgnify:CR=1 FL=1